MLIEFETGTAPSLLDMAEMEKELSDTLGRKVDLRTPDDLSPYFRDHVPQEAGLQYDS